MELAFISHHKKDKPIKNDQMKYFFLNLLLIGLLANPEIARADYSPTQLHYMILEADLTVYGEIDSVIDNYFFLKIKNKVFGEYNDTIIKVKKFVNWTCAQRWTEYKAGQNVFLFLVKDINKNWSIMSGGGEGELPIVKENIYLYAFYSIYMPFINFDRIDTSGKHIPKKFEVYEIYDSNFSGVKFKLDEFADAIEGIRACFQLTKGQYRTEDKIKLICTDERLNTYKSKSELNNWLAEKCMK